MENREKTDQSAKNGIQVIERAAAILRTLRKDPEGLSFGQIADRVGLARSTVQRIVSALQTEGFVTTAGNAGIRLGPELASFAAASKFDAITLCRPWLTSIAERTGETVDLSVFRGNKMLYLDQIPGTHRLRAVSFVGEEFPMTNSANGRATLALMSDEQAREIAEAEWQETGRNRDWERLASLLAETRETGLAFNRNEHTEGISAVGIAVRNHLDEIYAISVPVPSHRFEANLSAITKEVLRVSREFRRRLQAQRRG